MRRLLKLLTHDGQRTADIQGTQKLTLKDRHDRNTFDFSDQIQCFRLYPMGPIFIDLMN